MTELSVTARGECEVSECGCDEEKQNMATTKEKSGKPAPAA